MDICIKKTKHKGRGVFARKNFKKGEIIEVCPVIILSKKDTKNIDKTKLYDYYFEWDEKSGENAIVLGCGSMYNHSYESNATFKKDKAKKCFNFVAVKDIRRGEEITINYNGEASSKLVWFDKKPYVMLKKHRVL